MCLRLRMKEERETDGCKSIGREFHAGTLLYNVDERVREDILPGLCRTGKLACKERGG
jgi:hypothetical protein